MYWTIPSCLNVYRPWFKETLHDESRCPVVWRTPQPGRGHLSEGDLPHDFKLALVGRVSRVALKINFIVPFFNLKI